MPARIDGQRWGWWAAAVVAVVAAMLVGLGCEGRSAPVAGAGAGGAKPMRVVVSIQPLRGIVEPILVEAAVKHELLTLVPVGASEHGYEIPPSSLAAIKDADVVVLVGLGMEPQVEKYLKQHSRADQTVIILADALGLKAGDDDHADHAGHDDADHDHHHADHEHLGDPHFWLDPMLVEQALSSLVPALRRAAGSEDAGLRVVKAGEHMAGRVQDMHKRYLATISSAPRKTIVVGHDAWGYLARRYGLKTVAIKGLLASEPTPASMAEATKAAQDEGVKVIFVEPQISPAAANRIASATGAMVRKLDPLGDGDWFKMMDSNLREIGAALGAPAAAKNDVPTSPKAD